MSMLTIERILLLVLFATMVMGCSPIAKDGQLISSGAPVTLRAGQTVGQTFQARDSGLDGIQVYLSPQTQGAGTLRMHLRNASNSAADIETASLPVQQVNTPTFYRFGFSPRDDSFKHAYYFLLDVEGEGSVQVAAAPGDVFLDGALYQDGNPVDAQATFRLTYDPVRLGLGLLPLGASWLGFLAIAIFLYVFPGLALLTLLWRDGPRVSWGEKLGLAIGISVALYPLLLLWTHLVGLQLGALYAWIPPLASLAFLVWHHRKLRLASLINSLRAWRRSDSFLPDAVLIFLIVLIVFTRFWVIRTLDVPMWGDSYQHTMIAQLIVDNGGLFDSWQPYAPYDTFTVQFGFPVTASLLSWIMKMNSALSIITMGQIINSLAVFTLYPLAARLADGNRWAGVGALLIAGLLSPMPSYYVNWGRYAQLAGQLILPVSLWLVWGAIESSDRSWRKIALAGAVLVGMTLTYYRMPFYYVPFILTLLFVRGLTVWKLDIRRWSSDLSTLVLVAVVAVILFLPWMINIPRGNLQGAVEDGVINATPLENVLSDYRAWIDITYYVPLLLLVSALAGLIWSLIKKRWVVASIGLWVIGLASLVAGQVIRLPGASLMQNFAVLIALYIPVGLLGGYVLSQIMISVEQKNLIAGWMIVGFLFVIAVSWGSKNQITVQNPQAFALVTPPDVEAMSWIRNNTQGNARFLTEGFSIYNGLSAVGADAGWWIPLLANRSNTMPPQYALFNEKPIESDYSQRVIDLVRGFEKESPASSAGIRLLCNWGITHVFIGQRQGNVGAGVKQLYSAETFTSSKIFTPIYHQDRVFVYALNRQACASN